MQIQFMFYLPRDIYSEGCCFLFSPMLTNVQLDKALKRKKSQDAEKLKLVTVSTKPSNSPL